VGIASDARYHKYEKFLSDGWIPGRKVDNSDAQYHTFRGNLPYMAALLLLHPLLRKAWESVVYPASQGRPQGRENGGSSRAAGSYRLEQRASFDYAFALFFLFVLHGVSALKVLLILYVNYQLATKLSRSSIPLATWAFNIPILFANELCEGYPLSYMASFIAPASAGSQDSTLMQWGGWLDSFGGLVPRWEVLFNITILRLISFNMDYYWSIDRRHVNSVEVGPAFHAPIPSHYGSHDPC
jgi:hypothetical protein